MEVDFDRVHRSAICCLPWIVIRKVFLRMSMDGNCARLSTSGVDMLAFKDFLVTYPGGALIMRCLTLLEQEDQPIKSAFS